MSARLLCALVLALSTCAGPALADILKVGDEFPGWHMVRHDGAHVTSADYLGRSYVLWFYPSAMTPGCTAEGRGFKDRFGAFQGVGIAVLGVSFDPPQANAAFVASEGFPFPLLSDSERELALRVGAAETAEDEYASRISYLVGKDGRVVKVYKKVQPVRHAQEILIDIGAGAP